jgi:hypothetical protein
LQKSSEGLGADGIAIGFVGAGGIMLHQVAGVRAFAAFLRSVRTGEVARIG